MGRDQRADSGERDARNGRARRRSRGRGPGLRRLIATAAFLPLAGRAPLYARLLWSLISDSRTTVPRKALLAGAFGYVIVGRDVVPDRVPILGQLDDLVVVALAIDVFLEGVDEALLREKLEEAGIPRAAYDEDVARVRRMLPGPLRRAARRIPGAIRVVTNTIAQSGVQPRLRAWIEREGSTV